MAKLFHQSHVDCHDVRFVERLRTIGTLAHPVGNTILNTVVAESMTTRLDGDVLEVVPANSAQSKSLACLVKNEALGEGTYSKHFFLARLVA